ncbi:hypothetical protein Tco_0743762 [Tanacetum coccineum]
MNVEESYSKAYVIYRWDLYWIGATWQMRRLLPTLHLWLSLIMRMVQKHVLNNVKNGTGQREVRSVWTNAMRVNHKKNSNSRRKFAPTAVLTKSGLVPFSTARQSFSRTTTPVSAARVLNSPYFMVKSWLVQDQTVLALAIPGQTTTGKESSNPFMAGSLPKTISPMIHLSQKVIHLEVEKTSKESHAQTLTMLMKKVKRLEDKLKMIFNPNEEDDIWLNQQYWELLRWKLHEYSGVYSLFLDGTSIHINMLVEKKYPLKKEILVKMINLKIEAEEESNMAHELIKFIKSQIAEQS